MKHYLITPNFKAFLYLFLSFFVHYSYGQCPVGDVTFTSQSDLTAFANDYPTCTTIDGDLSIGASMDITDLSALGNIVTINGDFIIVDNTILSDLSGIDHEISISGSLSITGNILLSNCNVQSICDFIYAPKTISLSGNSISGNCNSVESIIGIPMAQGTVIALDQDGNETGVITVVSSSTNNPFVETVCSGAGGRLQSLSSSTPVDNCGNGMMFHVVVVGNGTMNINSQVQEVPYIAISAFQDTDLFPLVNNSTNTQYVSIKVTPYYNIDGNTEFDPSIDIEGTEIVYNIAVTGFHQTASSNSPVCEGGNISLTTDGGNSWSWSSPSGFTSTDQNPTISNATSTNGETYSVTITDINGCTKVSTTDVIVDTNPIANAGLDQNICEGESVSLTATGGGTYEWSTNETSASITVSPTATTNYTITITENGCTSTDEVTVTVIPLITPEIEGSVVELNGIASVIGGPTIINSSTNNPYIATVCTGQGGELRTVTSTTPIDNCGNPLVLHIEVIENTNLGVLGDVQDIPFTLVGTGLPLNLHPLFNLTSQVQSVTIKVKPFFDIDGVLGFTSGDEVGVEIVYTLVVKPKPVAICIFGARVGLNENGEVQIYAEDLDGGSIYPCGLDMMTVTPSFFNCSNIGANEVTLTITDNAGNTSSCMTNLTIEEYLKPIATEISTSTVIPNFGFITDVTTEGCGTESIINGLPLTNGNPTELFLADLTDQDLSFTDNCGILSYEYWDVLQNQISDICTTSGIHYVRIFKTYDLNGNATVVKQNLYIKDTTDPLVSGSLSSVNIDGCSNADAPTPFTSVAEIEAANGTVIISDNCTSKADLVVTVSGSTSNTCPIVMTRTYTITDACGQTTTLEHVLNINDTESPVITNLLTDVTVEGCSVSDAPAKFTTVGAIEAATGNVTVTDCISDIDLVVNSTETAIGTCPIVLTRTYTITDACGQTTNLMHTIHIDDDISPVILGSLTDTAVDACDLTFLPTAFTTVAQIEGATGNPSISDGCIVDASLTITHSESIPTGTCPMVVTRTYMITDDCGNSSTINHILSVGDQTSPVIDGSLSTTQIEGCSISDAPAAFTTIAALEANVGIINISDDCTIDTDLVVSVSGEVTGTCPIIMIRTYTVTDACGNSSTITHEIQIDDTENPTISGLLTRIQVEGCSASDAPAAFTTITEIEAATGDATISDNCTIDAELIVSSSESENGTCPIVLSRVYTIQDACGNTNTINHSIHITDNTIPTITGTLTDTEVEGCSPSDAPTPFASVTEMEAATGDLVISDCSISAISVTSTIVGSCPIVMTRTYTILDGCFNSNTFTHVIKIDDNLNPEITQAQDQTVACDGSGNTTELNTWLNNYGGATATDACGNITWSNDYTSQDVDGSTLVTFTASDDCGNSITSQSSFIVSPIIPESTLGYAVCKDGAIPTGEGLQATCSACIGVTDVKWYATATSTDVLATGSPFNPSSLVNDFTVTGTYAFYAECSCSGCISERVAVDLVVTEPIGMVQLSTSVSSICEGTTDNPNLSFELFVDILDGTGPYTVSYSDGVNNYVETNYMSGDAIDITTVAMVPSNQSYIELTYKVTNIIGGCVGTIDDFVKVTVIDCGAIVLDDYELDDPCKCKDNATDLDNGQFDETVTLAAPPGQIWTVRNVTGLYQINSHVPTLASERITVGTQFVETNTPSTIRPGAVIYKLEGVHVDGIGYEIQAENINLGVFTPSIGNKCYYPTPEILDFPDVICNSNIYEIPFSGRADRGDGLGVIGVEADTFRVYNNGSLVYGPAFGGDNFNPSNLPVGQYTLEYTFNADSLSLTDPTLNHGPPLGFPGCTQSIYQPFSVISCNSCENGACPYFLVMKSTVDGWDGAVMMVSINEGPEETYKMNSTDGKLKIYELCVSDGGFLDLRYMEGANNDKHSWYVVDVFGNIVNDMNGVPLEYGPTPPSDTKRMKANCPDSTCENEFEHFTVRVTLGTLPQVQSWEITEYDGTRLPAAYGVSYMNARQQYLGLAPGTQVEHAVRLDLCEEYTITLQTSDNGLVSNQGRWELISNNIDYGHQILDSNDSQYGASQLIDLSFTETIPAVIRKFTVPCKSTCPTEVVSSDVIRPINGTCYNNVNIPLVQPEVCYPYRNHGLGCTITENIYWLRDGLPYRATDLTFQATMGSIDPTDPTVITQWADFTNQFGIRIPVGCHKLVYELTYCDGIITKCTTDLIVVSETNPSLTGNDHVNISLGRPDDNPAEGGWNQGYADDYGECVVKVLADMVLEMPTSCVDDFNSEFMVTLFNSDGDLITQYGEDGLPLDAAGNSIPTALSNTIDAAHDLIGPDQVGQILTYMVEHKYSHTKTWGTILVEDKTSPTLICHDFDIECTHPYAMDPFYKDTTVYGPPATEMPADIAGGSSTIPSSSWMPVNIPCTRKGEVVKSVCVDLNITHNKMSDLIFVLHAPTTMNISPVIRNSIEATNRFCFTEFNGKQCNDAESEANAFDVVVLENNGNQKPALYGKTWYLEVIDNNSSSPFGGGEVTLANLEIVCGFPTPYDVYDCTLQTVDLLSNMPMETNCDQSDWNGAFIMRTWQAIDAYGNTAVCEQRVNLKAPPLSELVLPSDITIDCSEEVGTFTPDITGGISFGCDEVNTDSLDWRCDILATYVDQNIAGSCVGKFKIKRTWTYGNDCTNVFKNFVQFITIDDTTGPHIGLDTIRVGADNNCTADVKIDVSSVTDNCSGVRNIMGTYLIGSVLHTFDLTTETIPDLPMGPTVVIIDAKDNCLNASKDTLIIIVEDDSAPIARCEDQINLGIININELGVGRVSAEIIDNGSSDNCGGSVTLQIRRLDGCLGISEYDQYVNFECCDAGDTVTIELLVTDEAGNSNICTSSVFVQNNNPFEIVSIPADFSAVCGGIPEPDGVEVEVSGVCTNLLITSTDIGVKSELCNVDTEILRVWSVTNGITTILDTQHIDILLEDVTYLVKFPEDITIATCPDTLVTNAGKPEIIRPFGCTEIFTHFEDVRSTLQGESCYEIKRTWEIVNGCLYDFKDTAGHTDLGVQIGDFYEDDDGYFKWVQTITVIDTVGPLLDCPSTTDFCDVTDGCQGEAKLIMNADDACTIPENLSYAYRIDLDNDGNFNTSLIDIDTNFVTDVYPYGTHSITWMVTDGCGNMSTCTYEFRIRDCKSPTVFGQDFDIGTGNDTCIVIWANDFVIKAFDNCTDSLIVFNSIKGRINGTTGPFETNITVCCSQSPVFIEIQVEDDAAPFPNKASVTSVLTLSGCPGDRPTIAGRIETQNGEAVQDVIIYTDKDQKSSNESGYYYFKDMFTERDYNLTPVLDNKPLAGVSVSDIILLTKHILGVKPITDPYTIIAGDINKDGSVDVIDLVDLRRMLLLIDRDFKNNTSWVFVDKNYLFKNPNRPMGEPFPESIQINNLSKNMMSADFIGIKVGDFNGTVISNDNQRSNRDLHLITNNMSLVKGERFKVEVKSSDFENIEGLRFALGFDIEKVDFVGISEGKLDMSDHSIGTSKIQDGIITCMWVGDIVSADEDEVLFVFEFQAREGGLLEDVLTISNRYIDAEACFDDGLCGSIDLTFIRTDGSVSTGTDFKLYQNKPNPFGGFTLIGFSLPTAESATIRIFDVSGRELMVISDQYEAGYNEIRVNRKTLKATGVLYYQLETRENIATKKMIILE